ncbi:MAG TPA: PaaI family thioesterase [Syntrophomonadaceae bacterium]|nr:PaaI family thioesterase [Syntrophomonadaceae bacterium]HPU48846.1 PaaI family thioesterase [Syntrophomonadaceae bacterium]
MSTTRHRGEIELDLGPTPYCFSYMQGRILDFIEGESLTISFPVMKNYLNPNGSMQGGFITAAFDNVFGPLCYTATKTTATTTINIITSYHRPIYEGDELIITATVKNKGRTKIHMTAEAYNQENKLVATASCDYIRLPERKLG